MRTLNNAAVFFASFVVLMFVMLPFCEAEVISVNSGMQNVKSPFAAKTVQQDSPVLEQKAENVMAVSSSSLPSPVLPSSNILGAQNIAYGSNGIPLGSRMAAMDAMSFVQAPIDPITKENMVKAGYELPPSSPVPSWITVPVPPVPPVYPMTVNEAKQFAAEVDASLSMTAEGRAVLARANIATTAASSIISQMNYEQNVFDTPAVMSNVDPNSQCIMPGIPGAEMSGEGYDTESTGESAMSNADANSAIPPGSSRPSGSGGGFGEITQGEGDPRKSGGGGGGDDNDPGASYANAKARGEYLDTIGKWADETYKQGQGMVSVFKQIANDPNKLSAMGSAAGEVGSADYWSSIGSGLESAWNGLQDTIDLYKSGMDTFTKITNAIQDKSGKGAGSMIYNYNGVMNECKGKEECAGAETFYHKKAKTASDVEKTKADMRNPALTKEEYAALEKKLKKDEAEFEKAQGFSQATVNQYLDLKQKVTDTMSKNKDYTALLDKQAKIEEKYGSDIVKDIGKRGAKIKELDSAITAEKDSKKKAELQAQKEELVNYQRDENALGEMENKDPQIKQIKKEMEQFNKDHPPQEGGVSLASQVATGQWLKDKAKEFGLNDPADAMTWMGIKNFDNQLEGLIGNPTSLGAPTSETGGQPSIQPPTGLHGSLDQLKKTFEVLKDVMDPKLKKQTEKDIKDYEERLGDGNPETPAKKGSLEKGMDDLKKTEKDALSDKDLSDKEAAEIQKKQGKVNADALDLAADIAKTFKEIITGTTKGLNQKVEDLWGKIKDAIGERPSADCSTKKVKPCPADCPIDLYGKAEATAAEAAAAAANAAAEEASAGAKERSEGAAARVAAAEAAANPPTPQSPPGQAPAPSMLPPSPIAPIPSQTPAPIPNPQAPAPNPAHPAPSTPVPQSKPMMPVGSFSLVFNSITGFITGADFIGPVAPAGAAGGAGPPGPSAGGGSSAQCIKAASCFKFPEPEAGDGGAAGGADRRKGGVPAGLEGETGEGGTVARGGEGQPPLDIQMGAGEGSPEAVVVEECKGGECVGAAPDPKVPVVDPVPQGAANVDMAQRNVNTAVTNAATNHGLTPVPGQPGVYQDRTGAQYVPDATGVGGFVARTGSGQASNQQAATDLDNARTGLGNAISTGNPPAVSVAQTNLNNAQTKYDATVSIPFTSKEQDDIQFNNLKLIEKTLESIKTKIEQKYTNPKDRSPEDQKAYFDATNHQLIVRLAEIQLKYQNSGSFEMYAEMQAEYEKLIDSSAKEGQAIAGKEDGIKTDITNLMNNLNYFSNTLAEKLNKANAIEKDYKWKIDQQKTKFAVQRERYTQLDLLRKQGLNSISPNLYPNLEQDSSDAFQKSLDAEAAIKGLVGEANSKLKENVRAVEKARDEINAARDDLLKKYDELAKMKLAAPGLTGHFYGDKGALSKKGQQFKELKAAEKAALMDKFNQNSQKALMGLMSQLSGAAGAKAGADQTVAAQAKPVSTSIPDFPVEFDLAGNLINAPLASLFPGDVTATIANAQNRNKISLEVQKSAGDFRDFRKVMKVKGNKFDKEAKKLPVLSAMKQALDSGNIPPEMLTKLDKLLQKAGAAENIKLQAKEAAREAAASERYLQYSSPTGWVAITGAGVIRDKVTEVYYHNDAEAAAVAGDIGKGIMSGLQAVGELAVNTVQYGRAVLGSKSARHSILEKKELNSAKTIANFKKMIDDDLATTQKKAYDIQQDINAEIKQSGFKVDYQVKALLWDARQMSDAEFLEALSQSKAPFDAIGEDLAQGIRNLEEQRKAESIALQAEEKARLEECGADEQCKHNVRLEFNAKFDAFNKKYDAAMAVLREKLEGYKKTSEYVKAMEEIDGLKNDAQQRAVNDAVENADIAFKLANGQLDEVTRIDEEKGILKSMDIWTELVFEDRDVWFKQESAWLMDDINTGAKAFKQLMNTLELSGLTIDALLNDDSWKDVNPNDENSVSQWLESINNKYGLQGDKKLSASALDEKELALYWQTFGNGLAKMVKGSYDPADTAMGYLIIGNIKKEHGDLEGAISDLNTARDTAGTSIAGGIVSERARELGATAEGDNFVRTMQRAIFSTVLDPLNVATLGIGAGVAIIKTGMRLLRVSEALTDVAQLASSVAKATRGAIDVVPVLGRVVNGAGDVGSKLLGRVGNIGRSTVVKDIRGMVDDLLSQAKTAESEGEFRKVAQLTQQADDYSKGLKSLIGGETAAGRFGGLSAPAKDAINSLTKQTEDAWKAVINAGNSGSADDLGKALANAKDLGQKLDDVGAAGKMLKEKPAAGLWGFLTREHDIFGGNAPRKVLDDMRNAGDDVGNALKNINYGLNRGADIEGDFKSLQSAVKNFEQAKNVKDATKYMGWGYQSWRGFTENMNYFGESAGLIKPSETVRKARNAIISSETMLKDALQTGNVEDISRAWTKLDEANKWLGRAKGTIRTEQAVTRGRRALEEATPSQARPAPVAKLQSPADSANEVRRNVDSATPVQLQARAAADEQAAGRLSGRAAENAKNRAEELKQAAARKEAGVPVAEVKKPVPKPAVEAPRAVEAQAPATRMTPEQAKAKLFDDIGIKEEKFTQYRVRAEDGSYKQVTNAELQTKYGPDWEAKVSELSKGDAPQIQAYEQVRYKKGNVWIKEDEAMSKVVNKIRTQQLDDLGQTNKKIVDLQTSKSQYYEAIQDGDISEAEGLAEINKLDKRVSELKGQFDKTAKGLTSEEVDKLYEGQESYLTYLRNKIKGASESERKLLNEDYRKISAQQDALFELQSRAPAPEVSKPIEAVPTPRAAPTETPAPVAQKLEDRVLAGVKEDKNLLTKQGAQADVYIIDIDGTKNLVKKSKPDMYLQPGPMKYTPDEADKFSQTAAIQEALRMKDVEGIPNIPKMSQVIIKDIKTGQVEILSDASGLERKLAELDQAAVGSALFKNKEVYVVSDLVEGKGKMGAALTLDEYLKIPGNKVRPDAYDDLVNSIKQMHERGVAHTDIHAGNVLIDSDGNLHLIDFGLAQNKKTLGADFDAAKDVDLGRLNRFVREQISNENAWAVPAPRAAPVPVKSARDSIIPVSKAEVEKAKNLPVAVRHDKDIDRIMPNEFLEELGKNNLYDDFVKTLRNQKAEFFVDPKILDKQMDDAAEVMAKYLGDKGITPPAGFRDMVRNSIEAPMGGIAWTSDGARTFNNNFARAVARSREDRMLTNWIGTGEWVDNAPSEIAMQQTFEKMRFGKHTEYRNEFISSLSSQGYSPEEIKRFEGAFDRMGKFVDKSDEVDKFAKSSKAAAASGNKAVAQIAEMQYNEKVKALEDVAKQYGGGPSPVKKATDWVAEKLQPPVKPVAPKPIPTTPTVKKLPSGLFVPKDKTVLWKTLYDNDEIVRRVKALDKSAMESIRAARNPAGIEVYSIDPKLSASLDYFYMNLNRGDPKQLAMLKEMEQYGITDEVLKSISSYRLSRNQMFHRAGAIGVDLNLPGELRVSYNNINEISDTERVNLDRIFALNKETARGYNSPTILANELAQGQIIPPKAGAGFGPLIDADPYLASGPHGPVYIVLNTGTDSAKPVPFKDFEALLVPNSETAEKLRESMRTLHSQGLLDDAANLNKMTPNEYLDSALSKIKSYDEYLGGEGSSAKVVAPIRPITPVTPAQATPIPKPKTRADLTAELEKANAEWKKATDAYASNPTSKEKLDAFNNARNKAKAIEKEIKALPAEPSKPIAQRAKEYPAELKRSAESALPIKQSPKIVAPDAMQIQAKAKLNNNFNNAQNELVNAYEKYGDAGSEGYQNAARKYVDDLNKQKADVELHLKKYPKDNDAIALRDKIDGQIKDYTPEPVVEAPVQAVTPVPEVPKPVSAAPNPQEIAKFKKNVASFQANAGQFKTNNRVLGAQSFKIDDKTGDVTLKLTNEKYMAKPEIKLSYQEMNDLMENGVLPKALEYKNVINKIDNKEISVRIATNNADLGKPDARGWAALGSWKGKETPANLMPNTGHPSTPLPGSYIIEHGSAVDWAMQRSTTAGTLKSTDNVIVVTVQHGGESIGRGKGGTSIAFVVSDQKEYEYMVDLFKNNPSSAQDLVVSTLDRFATGHVDKAGGLSTLTGGMKGKSPIEVPLGSFG